MNDFKDLNIVLLKLNIIRIKIHITIFKFFLNLIRFRIFYLCNNNVYKQNSNKYYLFFYFNYLINQFSLNFIVIKFTSLQNLILA